MTLTPIESARALHMALESGKAGEALRALFTDDAVTVEHPNRLKPTGAITSLAQMIAASTEGAGLLAWQRFEERDAIETQSAVVMRSTWTGEVAADVGPFHAGQQLTAHVAQFFEVRDGRIAGIETYDCYEPF